VWASVGVARRRTAWIECVSRRAYTHWTLHSLISVFISKIRATQLRAKRLGVKLGLFVFVQFVVNRSNRLLLGKPVLNIDFTQMIVIIIRPILSCSE